MQWSSCLLLYLQLYLRCKMMIMQHFSHYMSCYYFMSCCYIMSDINKALNVITLQLHYAPGILLHYEPIITFWTFITFKLLHYEPLLHYYRELLCVEKWWAVGDSGCLRGRDEKKTRKGTSCTQSGTTAQRVMIYLQWGVVTPCTLEDTLSCNVRQSEKHNNEHT